MNKDQLEEKIKKAFSTVAYPGDRNIVTHPCNECDRVARTFIGLHWSDVPQKLSEIMEHTNLGFISLLSAEAFHFFVPGFMIVILENYRTTGGITDSLITAFDRPSKSNRDEAINEISGRHLEALKNELKSAAYPESDMQKRHDHRMSFFDSAQREATMDFFNYLKMHHPDDDPLNQFDRIIANIRVLQEKHRRG